MFRTFDFFLFTVHRSLFTAILGAAIFNLALFSTCSAIQLGPESGAAITNKPAQAKPAQSPPASVQGADINRQTSNIVVDRIESGAIYSKDGQKFEITPSTQVIDNSGSHPAARTRSAELIFANGSLVQVILK